MEAGTQLKALNCSVEPRSILRGKVSIVIPCFNYGATLPDTLASIEAIPRQNLAEVIIVDDGSTDASTVEYLDSLRIHGYQVIRTSNQGLGRARNRGISASRGEYILPVDSDNRLTSAYVTSGVRCLDGDSSLGVVYGNAIYFGERSGCWNVPELNLRSLATMNTIDACALYRRSLWEDLGGYDELMPAMGWEDWDFWLRSVQRGWKFLHIDEICFEYRVHSGSMIGRTNQRAEELLDYIFRKPENATMAIVRELNSEIAYDRELRKALPYRVASAFQTIIKGLKRAVPGR